MNEFMNEFMNELLVGKVCLITGAGRGIGRAIAERFALEGAMVYANDLDSGEFDKWMPTSECKNLIRSICFDITDEVAVKNAIMAIKKESGRIDVLVNNAGIEFNESIGMISHKNMEKMFQVNVFAMVEMIQVVSRVMSRQQSGSIINISSIVGRRGNPGQLVYSATKGAVIALTKSAAKELAVKNIRVNSIAPGLTNTRMMKAENSEKLQQRINNISLGRLAEPLEIANACLFLASDLSSYVSGQVIGVDGCSIL